YQHFLSKLFPFSFPPLISYLNFIIIHVLYFVNKFIQFFNFFSIIPFNSFKSSCFAYFLINVLAVVLYDKYRLCSLFFSAHLLLYSCCFFVIVSLLSNFLWC